MKDQLEARLKTIDEQLEAIGIERASIRQQLAEIKTEFKVGDRVTFAGSKDTWELQSIKPGLRNNPKFFGAAIKKNGEPGLRIVEIWPPYNKNLFKITDTD